jgi:Fe-S cluster assembly ATP-binding protein
LSCPKWGVQNKKMALHIKNLSVSIDGQKIIDILSLTLNSGSLHAIMGPNGSGKSTLAHAIAGNPLYAIDAGSIIFNDIDITNMSPHERARHGIFLSFQQPPAIPGLTVFNLLKEIHQAITGDSTDLEIFHMTVLSYCQLLKLDRSFLDRSCNDGFSGGEKKRLELLQLLVIKPQLIILDEIDSGLDIDGLKLVQKVVAQIRRENKKVTILLITHYQKVIEYIQPDQIHLMAKGNIAASGDSSLINQIEHQGYDGYLKAHQS